MESNRQDLLPWLNKKSRAYLENGVTDIHKIKITYDSSELHSGRPLSGKHQLLIRIPFEIIKTSITNYEIIDAGFFDYMGVSSTGLSLFYDDIPDFADIKHKGNTFGKPRG